MKVQELAHLYYDRHDIHRLKQPERRLMSDMNPIRSDFQHASPSATDAGSHLLAQLFDCLALRPKLYTVELSTQLHD